jgi:hypothetical protein
VVDESECITIKIVMRLPLITAGALKVYGVEYIRRLYSLFTSPDPWTGGGTTSSGAHVNVRFPNPWTLPPLPTL